MYIFLTCCNCPVSWPEITFSIEQCQICLKWTQSDRARTARLTNKPSPPSLCTLKSPMPALSYFGFSSVLDTLTYSNHRCRHIQIHLALSTIVSCKSLSVFSFILLHTPFFKYPVAVSEMLHPLPIDLFSVEMICHFYP